MHGTFNGVHLRRITSLVTELAGDRTLATSASWNFRYLTWKLSSVSTRQP